MNRSGPDPAGGGATTAPLQPGQPPDGTAAIAAFDFDGTLLDGDTLLILHRLIRGPLAGVGDGLALLPAALAWKSGARSTHWFKQCCLRRLIGAIPPHQRAQVLEQALPQALLARLRPEALARLEEHRRAGHRLLIISASPRQLLQPVATTLGLELLATETSDLRNHSREAPLQLVSANCKGPEKIHRLQNLLQHPPEAFQLHAYGDSRGDRELLQAAAHPHWRSFSHEEVPYPAKSALPLLPLLALTLLALLGWGLLGLPAAQRGALVAALMRLPLWLPAIYGVLAAVFLLRYWRWRLLLGGYGVGRWSWPDAIGWFQGFALTATPAKLGELARVQSLHRQLAYPRLPLLQVFLIERLLDLLAVVTWLAGLAPAILSDLLRAAGQRGSADRLATPELLLPLLITLGLGLALACVLQRRRLARLLDHGRRRLGLGASRDLLPAAAAAAVVSLLIWGAEPLILWLLVQALAPQAISVGQAIAIYLMSGTAGMASSLPGGIGVNEGATVLLLQQQQIPFESALAIAILRRLVSPWSIVALSALLGAVAPRGKTMQPARSRPWP